MFFPSLLLINIWVLGPELPDVYLVTLDTVRADALSCYGGRAETPEIDAIAKTGTRYLRAYAPAPLTLPSHASIMTGLYPALHGLRDNGLSVLSAEQTTLAETMADRGYTTGAFVGSMILDRRFGLDQGFQVYDDRMSSDFKGEFGYPERHSKQVVRAFDDWVRRQQGPIFTWLHFYDAHAPYTPQNVAGNDRDRYHREIQEMDQAFATLKTIQRRRNRPVIWIITADHGEMLGAHGEATHGIFLYREAIQVPLIIAGQGIKTQSIATPVSLTQIAGSLIGLTGAKTDELPTLPGLGGKGSSPAIFAESFMPATAYGWSPLFSYIDGDWQFIHAPRPELYQLNEDPQQTLNLVTKESKRAGKMAQRLQPYTEITGELGDLEEGNRAILESLGYVSGQTGSANDGLDAKDGLALLDRFKQAKDHIANSEYEQAIPILSDLLNRNPSNIPFHQRLAEAQLQAGHLLDAEATLHRALQINPRSEFLILKLAQVYHISSRWQEADAAYGQVLAINPRQDEAWLSRAEIALRQNQPAREKELLEEAIGHGTASAGIYTRLGTLAFQANQLDQAEGYFKSATDLTPSLMVPWLIWALTKEKQGLPQKSMDLLRIAYDVDPSHLGVNYHIGRLLLASQQADQARPFLTRVAQGAPNSDIGRHAAELLQSLQGP